MQTFVRRLVYLTFVCAAIAFNANCFGQDDGRGSGQVRGNVYVYMNDGGQTRTIGTVYIGGSGQPYLEFDNYGLAFEYLDQKNSEGYQTNYSVTYGNCFDRNGDPCYMEN